MPFPLDAGACRGAACHLWHHRLERCSHRKVAAGRPSFAGLPFRARRRPPPRPTGSGWQTTDIAALQSLLGNSAVSRLVAGGDRSRPVPTGVQRDPTGPEPPPPVVKETSLADRAIDFATRPGTVAGVGVRVTGRLRVSGKASVRDAQLTAASTAPAVGNRAAALLLTALNAASATGSATRIEIDLAGKPLILELATTPTGPAFQVTADLTTTSGPLTVPGVDITGPRVTLSATVWITPPAPAPAPAGSVPGDPVPSGPVPGGPVTGGRVPGGPTPAAPGAAPAAAGVGDSTIRSLGYAGALAVFSDALTPNRREGDGKAETIRTGSVSLKSTFDAIDSRLSADVKAGALGFLSRDEQKLAWLQEMRAYFGTDDKTIDHFAKLRKVAIRGAATIMHEEAAVRLEAVQAELGAAVMPSSGGIGWPRSECRLGGRAGLANLHNLGFAIDYNATQAPHIKDSRIKDLISVTTGRGPVANYPSTAGIDTRKVGETVTTGTDAEKAAIDQNAKVTQWLDGVEAEATALGQASEDFRGSLQTTANPNNPAGATVDNAPKLIALRQRWQAAAGKKKAERDVLQAAILTELPAVVAPWLAKIAASRAASQTALTGSGVAPATLPADLAAIAKAAVAADALRTRARPTLAAAAPAPATAGGPTPVGPAPSTQTPSTPVRSTPGPSAPAPAQAQFSRRELAALTGLMAQARTILGEGGPAPTLSDRAAVIAELKRLDELLDKRGIALLAQSRIIRMTTLERALADGAFMFGGPRNAVVDPSAAQLVDQGFFTLQGSAKAGAGAFSPAFVRAMLKHGFGHGGEWGTPDLMHFELRWKGPGQ